MCSLAPCRSTVRRKKTYVRTYIHTYAYVCDRRGKKICGDDPVEYTKMWNCIPCLDTTLKMIPRLSARPHIENIWEYPRPSPPRGATLGSDSSPSLSHPRIPRADRGAQENLGGGDKRRPLPESPSSRRFFSGPSFPYAPRSPWGLGLDVSFQAPRWSKFKMAPGTARWT